MFHATRDINQGEELSIYYIDIRKVRAERQRFLPFRCTCEVCCLQGAKQLESDKNRSMYKRLDDMLGSVIQRDPPKAMAHVNEMLRILRAEFDGNPQLTYVTYYTGFQCAELVGDFVTAKAMMRKAHDARTLAEGEHEDTVEWEACLQNLDLLQNPDLERQAQGADLNANTNRHAQLAGADSCEVSRPPSDHGVNSDSPWGDFSGNVKERPLPVGCREEYRSIAGLNCLLLWPRATQLGSPPPIPKRRCIILPIIHPISSSPSDLHSDPIDINLGRVFADMGFLSVTCAFELNFDLEQMRTLCSFLTENIAFAPSVPITSVIMCGYRKCALLSLACLGEFHEVQGAIMIMWQAMEFQPHVMRSCEKGLACRKPKLFVSGERSLQEDDDDETISRVQSFIGQAADPKVVCTIPAWSNIDDNKKWANVFDRITEWIKTTFTPSRTPYVSEDKDSDQGCVHRQLTCNSCGAVGKLLLCTGCRRAWYCSVACQRRHRPHHRSSCHQNKAKNLSRHCVVAKPRKAILLSFSRNPESFRFALSSAPELRACRDALVANGLSAELPCGAWTFIHPEAYESCMEALSIRNEQLDKRHVLVDPELETVVLKAIKNHVRGKEGVRCKAKFNMPLGFANAVVNSGEEVFTSRTFIEFKIREDSLRSAPSSGPVTVSTTDAHGGKNPRAA
jgi:hypothetical protein